MLPNATAKTTHPASTHQREEKTEKYLQRFAPESQDESIVDLHLIFKLSHQRRRNTTDSKPFIEHSSSNISWVRPSQSLPIGRNGSEPWRTGNSIIWVYGASIFVPKRLSHSNWFLLSLYEVASTGLLREGDKLSFSLWFIRNLRISILLVKCIM